MPNFSDVNVNVNVDKCTVVIQAECRGQESDKNKKYVVRESSSSFYRSFALPEQAEEQRITAEFDDGVLTVTVPLKELPAPTKIAIGSVHAAA